jgi:hypothetical protein
VERIRQREPGIAVLPATVQNRGQELLDLIGAIEVPGRFGECREIGKSHDGEAAGVGDRQRFDDPDGPVLYSNVQRRVLQSGMVITPDREDADVKIG